MNKCFYKICLGVTYIFDIVFMVENVLKQSLTRENRNHLHFVKLRRSFLLGRC